MIIPTCNKLVSDLCSLCLSTAAVRRSSWWSGVEQGPPDAIFGLVEAHKKDPRPNKVSVVIGAYRDGQGKPLVLPTVRKVCNLEIPFYGIQYRL